MNTFTPDWSNVRPLGRTCQLPDSLWLAFSGSGAEFAFTGRRCDVTLAGDTTALPDATENLARIAIEVDGVRVADTLLNAPEKTCTVVDDSEARSHVVRIVKLSETAMSTCGVRAITVDAPSIRPTPESSRFIEFVGDSITCGYGVDDPVAEHHFSTATEDVTKAYAYRTARALEADHSMVSISGYGIISGFSADGDTRVPNQIIPAYYTKLGFSYGAYQGQTPADVSWDFSARQPDLIVVNLGTNDDSFTQDHQARQMEYAAACTAFLRVIRQHNPDAQILCALGIMGDRLYPWLEKAVQDYAAVTGDDRISCLRFAVQDPADGYAADWHPTAETHAKAAQHLTSAIREMMGW